MVFIKMTKYHLQFAAAVLIIAMSVLTNTLAKFAKGITITKMDPVENVRIIVKIVLVVYLAIIVEMDSNFLQIINAELYALKVILPCLN